MWKEKYRLDQWTRYSIFLNIIIAQLTVPPGTAAFRPKNLGMLQLMFILTYNTGILTQIGVIGLEHKILNFKDIHCFQG